MTLEGAMLHTAFLLSVRGIPQLYYGDEIALAGGDDPDNRRDFPGGFPGDAHSAFGSGRNQLEQRMHEWTRDWIWLRRKHSAIRQGRTIDLVYDADMYAFARRSADETVIIIINRAAGPKKTMIPLTLLGAAEDSQLVPLLGAPLRVRTTGGAFTFDVAPATAVAYKLVSAEE
jgi:neopullulanase